MFHPSEISKLTSEDGLGFPGRLAASPKLGHHVATKFLCLNRQFLATLPGEDVQAYLLNGEHLTLQYLKEKTQLTYSFLTAFIACVFAAHIGNTAVESSAVTSFNVIAFV